MFYQIHIFELLNAAPGLVGLRLVMASALASYAVFLLPAAMAFAWSVSGRAERSDIAWAAVACCIAFGLSEFVDWTLPQPRPDQLHVGTQYIRNAMDLGLPSVQVTVIWTLAISAFLSSRFAVFCFPLFTLGLAVGWDRIYLGAQFPLDVVAALPVALVSVALAWLGRRMLA